MHGPRRADLGRSNQAAQEQSAQPEGTPPHLAGKRAKACPLAISLAADWFERTSRPSSYTPKSGRSRGADTRLNSPAPAHIIHEEGVIASPKRGGDWRPFVPLAASSVFPGNTVLPARPACPPSLCDGGPSSLVTFFPFQLVSVSALKARPRPWLRYGSISVVSFPLSVFRPPSTTAPAHAAPANTSAGERCIVDHGDELWTGLKYLLDEIASPFDIATGSSKSFTHEATCPRRIADPQYPQPECNYRCYLRNFMRRHQALNQR